MKDLFEQLLNITEDTTVGGWIKPDGTIENIKFQTHAVDAVRKMKRFTGKNYSNSHKAWLDLMKLKGYIAIDEEYLEGVDISVGASITSAQLQKIRKLEKDSNEFYYSIYVKLGKVIHGTKLNVFIEDLRKLNLLKI